MRLPYRPIRNTPCPRIGQATKPSQSVASYEGMKVQGLMQFLMPTARNGTGVASEAAAKRAKKPIGVPDSSSRFWC